MELKTDLRHLTDLWREIALRTAVARNEHADFIKAVTVCLDTMVPVFEKMVGTSSFDANSWEVAVTGIGIAGQMHHQQHDPVVVNFVHDQLVLVTQGQIACHQARAEQNRLHTV